GREGRALAGPPRLVGLARRAPRHADRLPQSPGRAGELGVELLHLRPRAARHRRRGGRGGRARRQAARARLTRRAPGPRAARNVHCACCRRVSRGGAWHMNGRWQPGAGGTTLLLVSERAEHRASLHAALEAEGHRILAAESARAGLGLLEAEAAAVLIV